MMISQLPNRVMVSGGGSGIGLAIVASLLESGCEVVAVGRRKSPLNAAASLGADVIPWDVTQDPEGLLDAAGKVDGLVHNAGQYRHGSCEDWTEADWKALWTVNALAPALLSRAFVRRLSGPGAIVAVSSTLASRPAVGTGAYASSKAALVALIQNLALELAPRGIRANAVLPGVVLTDMTVVPRQGQSVEEQREHFDALHPLGRMGTPEEVALAVVSSLGNPWMTGSIISIDGGLLVRE